MFYWIYLPKKILETGQKFLDGGLVYIGIE